MENVMQGIIDMHIHAAPDVRARKLDDLELMEASVQRGVRAIVLKSHNVPTADRAYLVNRVAAEKYPDAKFTAFGGLCLNHPVGGLNPDAVETSLKLGAKVIWDPDAGVMEVDSSTINRTDVPLELCRRMRQS